MATGSGLFKPIISGTIARTTDESNSALGFGIYYWMINLGAFLAPLVVSVLKGFSWRYVFVASALYTGLMLLPDGLRLPRPAAARQSSKSLREVLMGAAEVLGDSRFMLMIVVYSGFWVLYFQNFGTVLCYLRDFVDRAPVSAAVTSLLRGVGLAWTFAFDAEHVTVINAGTIILLQVFVSRIVKSRPPLPTMVTGMAIGALGFLLLASSRNAWVFIARHRRLLDRRDDRAPEVLQLRRPGRTRRPQGRLHGLRLPLRRLRLAARLEPRRLPLRADAQAGDRHARGRLARAAFWLLFAVLDVWPRSGSSCSRAPSDRQRGDTQARALMRGVYAAILLLGGGFLYLASRHTRPGAGGHPGRDLHRAGPGGLLVSRSRPAPSLP